MFWLAGYYLLALHSVRMARKRYGDRLLVVQHWDLVADQDKVLKRIYDFLGLPYYSQSSLAGFFDKTGFHTGWVDSSAVGLRTRLQQKGDSVQPAGLESAILKALVFIRYHLPLMVGLLAVAMRLVQTGKRRLRALALRKQNGSST